MAQTIQRYTLRRRSRDWLNPFQWFEWYFMATGDQTALLSVARYSEDAVIRLSEDSVTRTTE